MYVVPPALCSTVHRFPPGGDTIPCSWVKDDAPQLEHLIRAAAEIADDDDIVIIGSQAILGQFPDAPPSMRVSAEADLYPLHHPERADLNVEGVWG